MFDVKLFLIKQQDWPIKRLFAALSRAQPHLDSGIEIVNYVRNDLQSAWLSGLHFSGIATYMYSRGPLKK